MSLPMRFVTGSVLLSIAALSAELVVAGIGQQAILDHYAELAAADDGAFMEFSLERGEAIFREAHTAGNPDITSCTVCHTEDPTRGGETRVGKPIAPMAVSVSPNRFTDLAKDEKWFRRNCQTVIGRECTSLEKGDFILFMTSQ